MQSTKRASTSSLRMAPSPDDLEVSDPFARTKPA
jgi:hypothetical protein